MAKRSKGTGYLYKRGKIWWWQPPTINGIKQKPRSLKVESKEDAKKEIEKLLPNRKLKEKIDVILELAEAKQIYIDDRIDIKEAFKEFTEHPKRERCAESTLKQKEKHWKEFLNFLPLSVTTIDLVTQKQATKYLAQLKTKKTPRTYNAHLVNLKHIFNILKDKKDNPFSGFSSLDEETVNKKPLSAEMIARIFFAFDNKLYKKLPLTEKEKAIKLKEKLPLIIQNKEELEILFHIGQWTGQRLKDCALQEWKFIDLKNKIIKVLPYKTVRKKKERFPVPIHPDLYDSLLFALKWKQPKNDFVLPKIAERYLKPSTMSELNKDCMKVLKYIGLTTSIILPDRKKPANIYGFHSFRHAFAFFLLDAGVIFKCCVSEFFKISKFYLFYAALFCNSPSLKTVPFITRGICL